MTVKPTLEWINKKLADMHPVEIIIKPKSVIDYLSETIQNTFQVNERAAQKLVENFLDGKFVFRRIIADRNPEPSKIGVIVYKYEKGKEHFRFVEYLKGYPETRIIWIDEKYPVEQK